MNYKSITVPLDEPSELKILQVQSLSSEIENVSIEQRSRMNSMRHELIAARGSWEQIKSSVGEDRRASAWGNLASHLEEFMHYRRMRSEAIQRIQSIRSSIADRVGSSNCMHMDIPNRPYGFFVRGDKCMLTVFGVYSFEINLSLHDGLVLMKTQGRELHKWCIDRDDLVEINMDSFLLVDPVEGQTAQDRMNQAVAVCESIREDINNSFEF